MKSSDPQFNSEVARAAIASQWEPPSKANGYRAAPVPLSEMAPPPLREVQKLPKKQRALEILRRLKLMYPQAPCSLDYGSSVQLMVATVLSAQCTDARVNMTTPALFERFPSAIALADADLTELENLIRSTGFYRSKAKNIKAACQRLVAEFDGKMPRTMDELTTLPGVARKTANVVLAHAFDIHEGVTVDTHVKRISGLLGLTKHAEPVKIEQDLMKLLPRADWENWSIRLVYHGRAICDARNPDCLRCDLLDICPGAIKLRKEAAKVAKAKAAKVAKVAKAKKEKASKDAKAKKMRVQAGSKRLDKGSV